MRRLAALAAALAAALLVLSAPPASAGGPTSVLVVNYEGARAAGALTGSTAYADLEKALDPYTPPTGERTSPASFMATQVRLTWMIHDVTPWRVDAVIIDGDDVWVETAMDSGTGDGLFNVPSVRHRPRDPALLMSTLGALGVLGEKPAGSARPEASAPAPAPDAAAADTVSAARTTGAATGAPTATGSPVTAAVPWWGTTAAAVLALGLGLVLGRRVRPRGAPGALGPLAGDSTDHASNHAGGGAERPTNGRANNAAHHADGHADTERVAPVGFTADPDRIRR
jgi:hypothetical protein